MVYSGECHRAAAVTEVVRLEHIQAVRTDRRGLPGPTNRLRRWLVAEITEHPRE